MSQAKQKSPRRIPVSTKQLKLVGDGTQGVLLGRVCPRCNLYFFGSPRFCLNCTSEKLRPVELSQEGVLHTFTIVRMAPPGWQGPVPYILGVVGLPEGPRISAPMPNTKRSSPWKRGSPLG